MVWWKGEKDINYYLDSLNGKENETQYYFRQYKRYLARLLVMGILRKGERPSEGLLWDNTERMAKLDRNSAKQLGGATNHKKIIDKHSHCTLPSYTNVKHNWCSGNWITGHPHHLFGHKSSQNGVNSVLVGGIIGLHRERTFGPKIAAHTLMQDMKSQE